MLGWFQRLLPKTGDFFELFEAHATSLVAAADATGRLFQRGGPAGARVKPPAGCRRKSGRGERR